MVFNFGFDNIPIEEYLLEIKIGNNIQSQILKGIPEMVQLQFMNLLQEAKNSENPIKIKICKEETVWINTKKENKVLNNFIQFANKKYIDAFPDEFKEE